MYKKVIKIAKVLQINGWFYHIFQLRKPSDPGYEEFWVDFNIGSERLTLFCEQDSLMSQVFIGSRKLL